MSSWRAARRKARSRLLSVLIVVYGIAMLASVLLLLIGYGTLGDQTGPVPELQAAGFIGVLLCMTLGPIAAMLVMGRGDGSEELLVRVDEFERIFKRSMEQSALSDDARRALNRRAERRLLCSAIEEDITSAEWDAAIVLCNELAERFGYRADAEAYRSRIEKARVETVERGVTDAIAQLDGLIVQRQWDAGFREADRIKRLYPESPRVERLRERVEQARDVYKRDLERRFLEAAQADMVDEAMNLLKELDAYLTQSQGQQYQEVAKGVITKARENLGAQFKLAMQDQEWAVAAGLGRRIIDEFPNSRMAQEVREVLDVVLKRANGTAGVS